LREFPEWAADLLVDGVQGGITATYELNLAGGGVRNLSRKYLLNVEEVDLSDVISGLAERSAGGLRTEMVLVFRDGSLDEISVKELLNKGSENV
jgi:hypothetical protein